MKIKVDNDVNALYISLYDDVKIIESEELKPGFIVDYDKDDNIVGIEILDFKKDLSLGMLKNFQFETT